MYDERKERFSIKDVIIQVLFVGIFVFLLLWLFPMKSDVKKSFAPLYDQIFNQNVETMKEAAITYYTTPRLPQNIGDEEKMTLGEMLDNNLVLPFVDSKGNQCDLIDSYVSITKMSDEYILKVNLKCTEQEDYILVYLGCYDYCDGNVCERQEEEEEPTPTPTPTPTCTDNYDKTFSVNYYVDNALNKSVKVSAGNSVDLSGLTKDGYTFDGWYKDSNLTNKVTSVSAAATYDANGCITGYKNVNLYGKFTENVKPVVNYEYLYEYVLVINGKWGEYSDWSEWTKNKITETDYRAVETKVETETTYKEETVTTYEPIYGEKTVQTGTRTETYTETVPVTKYKTVPVYEQKQVQVGTRPVYGTTTVKVPIYETQPVYETREVTKYRTVQKFVRMEYSLDCSVNPCERVEKPIYETVQEAYTTTEKVQVGTKQVLVGYETQEKKVILRYEPIYETKTVQTGTRQEAYTTTETITKTRQVPIYETKTVQIGTKPVTKVVKTPVTTKVTYYRSKTREYISGTTDTKWSKSNNDQKLIEAGYSLTGNVKKIEKTEK